MIVLTMCSVSRHNVREAALNKQWDKIAYSKVFK